MGQSSEPGLLFGTSQNAKSTKQASEVSQLQQSNAFCRSLIFYGVYCRHYFSEFLEFWILESNSHGDFCQVYRVINLVKQAQLDSFSYDLVFERQAGPIMLACVCVYNICIHIHPHIYPYIHIYVYVCAYRPSSQRDPLPQGGP